MSDPLGQLAFRARIWSMARQGDPGCLPEHLDKTDEALVVHHERERLFKLR